jgi:hypothetical protein
MTTPQPLEHEFLGHYSGECVGEYTVLPFELVPQSFVDPFNGIILGQIEHHARLAQPRHHDHSFHFQGERQLTNVAPPPP